MLQRNCKIQQNCFCFTRRIVKPSATFKVLNNPQHKKRTIDIVRFYHITFILIQNQQLQQTTSNKYMIAIFNQEFVHHIANWCQLQPITLANSLLITSMQAIDR